jgi:hypothetical protein
LNGQIAVPVWLTTRTPLSAKLALTLPTSDVRSVGIVHLRTKTTAFVCMFVRLFAGKFTVYGAYILAYSQKESYVILPRKENQF